MNFDKKIAFIGGGNMAQAIIGGLLAKGLPADQIFVSEPFAETQEKIKKLKVNLVSDNIAAVKAADIVVLAVKPQMIADVLKQLAGQFSQQLVISIAAGVTVEMISTLLQGYARIARVMPNTPSLMQCGASGIYPSAELTAQDKADIDLIFTAVGTVNWVEDEQFIDAITAVSGSGPAYFFYMMEAMIEAGKSFGLDEKTAIDLTLQTALGAAKMAIDSPDTPGQLRKKVTSPKGTTEAAINVFDENQLSQHIQSALNAAKQRSKTLAEELAAKIK